MNIFFTHVDPKIAVTHLDDKRLVKMVLETAQLLCTAVNENAGYSVSPYKSTHRNHPSAKWVSSNLANFQWLFSYFTAICEEYHARYGKIHKSYDKIINSDLYDLAEVFIPYGDFTFPPNCAANGDFGLSFKHVSDVVTAYRTYLCARICLTDKNPRISKRDIDVNAYKSMFSVTDDDILSGIVQ